MRNWLLLLACGCQVDKPDTTAEADPTPDTGAIEAPVETHTVLLVLADVDEGNSSVEGATVHLLDGTDTLGTTDEFGAAFVELPVGEPIIRIEHPDYWSLLTPVAVDPASDDAIEVRGIAKAATERLAMAMDLDLDLDQALFEVTFVTRSGEGGERVDIDEAFTVAMTMDESAENFIIESQELVPAAGSDFIIFTGVTADSVGVTIQDKEGGNTCALVHQPTDRWPTRMGGVTRLRAECEGEDGFGG